MAIAVATTTLAPTYRLLPMLNGGIPLWVLTLIFIAFDYATIASANAGTAIAHLAGAATGFVFIQTNATRQRLEPLDEQSFLIG